MQFIDDRIEHWKKRLLDLGKRNRLINFKETKRSNVGIISPNYDALFERIVQNEEGLSFSFPLKTTYDELGEEHNISVQEGDLQTNKTLNEQQKSQDLCLISYKPPEQYLLALTILVRPQVLAICPFHKAHNINLRKQSEIYGEAYELNYVNTDGEFSATILTPLNAYILEDGSAERNVVLALHTFTKKFDDKKYLDVYTASEILHYELGSNSNKSTLNLIGSHEHIFGRVPITICPANNERISGFQDVVSLFDAYNSIKFCA